MSKAHSDEQYPRKVSSKTAKQGAVFTKPTWASAPRKRGVHLEVWRPKKGEDPNSSRSIVDFCYHASNICIDSHSYYLFGSKSDICDFVMHHPSCSRVHMAIVHHAETGAVYVVDLNSTHGTYINGVRLPAGKPTELKAGGVLKAGYSSRAYILRIHAPIRKEVKMEVADFLKELKEDDAPEESAQLAAESNLSEVGPRTGYHILIKHAAVRKPSFRGKAITRSKDEAIALLTSEIRPKIAAKPEEFAQVAKAYSECVSGQKSGGTMPPMVKEKDCGDLNPLRDALWALDEGAISDPIETILGVHLIMWKRA